MQTAAGAPGPGDPGGSRTKTIFSDDEKKRRKMKGDEKARKEREKVEKRERKVKEKRERAATKAAMKAAVKEEGGCFGWRRNGNSRVETRGTGGGMGEDGEVREKEKEIGDGGESGELMARRGVGGAPGPENPGGSGVGVVGEDEKARRGIMQGGVVEEKGCGCFGCRRF